jgi:hypothetical protein
MADLDQPDQAERGNCLAHRRATDAKRHGQLSL